MTIFVLRHLQSVSPNPGSSVFKIFTVAMHISFVKFFLNFFLSPPNRAENLVKFCRVFCKLDHLACNKIVNCNGEMRAVILKMYYMPNGLTSIIHNKILSNFQG